MVVTWQTVITFATVLGAVAAVMKYYNKAYDIVRHQNEQDSEINGIKESQRVLTRGMLACLQGLKEQGCDGPVTDAIAELQDYLSNKI